ncbi:MAG: tetratricopeptide repeat protein [Oscillospiraceae bacterium]|jgi:tetratricopeptide (TPR) repeat protein|nr:tetratricopeptide repeat protein [Oscillospiraceae bacterium]
MQQGVLTAAPIQLTTQGDIGPNPRFIAPPYFAGLVEQIQASDNQRLQLNGLAGMGKSAALQQIYCFFAHQAPPSFAFIAFFNYAGSCEQMLQTPLIGMPEGESPLAFLIRRAQAGRLLILIDDIAPDGVHPLDLSPLACLKATVVLAARRICEGFAHQINVALPENLLPPDDCRELYLRTRYRGATRPALSAADLSALDCTLLLHAAQHALVLQRLGTIAWQNSAAPVELEALLSRSGFGLLHQADNDEQRLEDELQKLYSVDNTNAEQRQVLSAMSDFPAMTLPLSMWADWLHESLVMGYDAYTCRVMLNQFLQNGWLIGDEAGVSLHLIVAQTIARQIQPDLLRQGVFFTKAFERTALYKQPRRDAWNDLALKVFDRAVQWLRGRDVAVWAQQQDLLRAMQHYWKYFPDISLPFLLEMLQDSQYPKGQQAQLIKTTGDLHCDLGQLEEAQACYAAAEERCRIEQDGITLADVLLSKGDLACRLGDMEGALAHYDQAESRYRQEQNSLGLAGAFRCKGDLERCLGQMDAALAHYAEAEGYCREERATPDLAKVLVRMGDLEIICQQFEAAKAHLDEAEACYRREGYLLGLADALRSRGDWACLMAQMDAAQAYYIEAEGYYRQQRHGRGLAAVLKSRGNWASRMGQGADAQAHYDEAERLFRQQQDLLGVADVLLAQGDLEREQNRYEMAIQQYEEAQTLYRKARAAVGIAHTTAALACTYPHTRDRASALAFYRNTLQGFDALPDCAKPFAKRCLEKAAAVLRV